MQDRQGTLALMEAFLTGLREYYDIYDSQEEYDRARQLCSQLRGLYGRLGPTLTELGVTREYEVMGTRYPVFESALSPYDPVTGSVVGQALDIAKAAVEMGVGTLRGRIERGEVTGPHPPAPPAPVIAEVRRRSFWYLWLMAGLALGWFAGKNEATVVSLFRSDAGWKVGATVALTLLTIGFALFCNLLTNIVHDLGWRRSLAERPKRFWSYVILTTVCGLGIAWVTIGQLPKREDAPSDAPEPPQTQVQAPTIKTPNSSAGSPIAGPPPVLPSTATSPKSLEALYELTVAHGRTVQGADLTVDGRPAVVVRTLPNFTTVRVGPGLHDIGIRGTKCLTHAKVPDTKQVNLNCDQR